MGKIIGITGGVACGKSTAARQLVTLIGANFVETDRLAKDAMATDPKVREAIVSQISPLAYSANGLLDRAWLRDAIFDDAGVKTKLESILHPWVRTKWMAEVGHAKALDQSLIVEIPLLYEVSAERAFDTVVVVAATEQVQVTRLVQHRNLSDSMARKILASQWPISDKVTLANHVLWNDSSPDLLARQVMLLSHLLTA